MTDWLSLIQAMSDSDSISIAQEESRNESESETNLSTKKTSKKSKLLKQAKNYRDEIDNRGVIYLSR